MEHFVCARHVTKLLITNLHHRCANEDDNNRSWDKWVVETDFEAEVLNLHAVLLMAFCLKVVISVMAGGGPGQWGLLNRIMHFRVRQI